MSFHNFFVLPIMSVAFLTANQQSFPVSNEPIENNLPVEVVAPEETEVNPVDEVVESRETVPTEVETSPVVIVESRGSIKYTQAEVRLYPPLESICTCESGRQFHADGSVVRGIVNPQDIGMCQINLKYHGTAADNLGYDLFTEVGNIQYANYLYDQQGPQPWFWSKPCHGIG